MWSDNEDNGIGNSDGDDFVPSDPYDDDGIRRGSAKRQGPPAVQANPMLRGKAADARRKQGVNRRLKQKTPKKAMNTECPQKPACQKVGLLSNARMSTTKEKNPRCELVALAGGKRTHVFTLTKNKCGPNFENTVKRVKLEIDKGTMTKDKCLEMRDELLKRIIN